MTERAASKPLNYLQCLPFSTEVGERLIFSEHQIKSEKAKSGRAELVVADRFIPLWSLPVTQKHSPLNQAIATQKWSFAGIHKRCEKHSGLLSWRAVVGGVSHPSSATLLAAAPEDGVGSSTALPPGGWFAGAVTALCVLLPALITQEGFISSPC